MTIDDQLDDQPRLEEELRAEQRMLEHARRCLRAMRRRTEAVTAAGAGGDEIATESLTWQLARRVEALTDDDRTGLFFGRLDYDDTAGEVAEERFYVGRRHVMDDDGDPVVIDWRAGVARPFYRASPARRYGVRLRRRFGYQAGGQAGGDDRPARATLTSIQDEPLTLLDETAGQDAARRVLVAEIERPRIGPMRDIVATIQPEQDDLIRAPLEATICVQGGPGTGKTAVGLHRAAFLLYEHAERLDQTGVLVVGPSAAYLAFIRDVLPGLGEVRVLQQTLAGLVERPLGRPNPGRVGRRVGRGPRPDAGRVEVTAADTVAAAAVKGDVRMAKVVRRAAFSHVTFPTDPLTLRYGQHAVTLPVTALRARVATLLAADLWYESGRAQLRGWVVERCQRQLEESGNLTEFDRPRDVERGLARGPELRAFVDRTWPEVDPVRLVYRLLSDPAFLAAAAGGTLDEGEQDLARWPRRPRGLRQATWSLADAFLVDEAVDVVSGTRTFGHVVADEAQDLSPMQLRAIGRRCRFGSATLLGDLAQATTPWSATGWEEALTHLGRPAAGIEQLPRAFRAPREVLDYANRLLPEIAPAVEPAASVRSVPGALDVRPVPRDALAGAWLDAVRSALAEEGSVGLITADAAAPAVRDELERSGLPFQPVDRFDPGSRLALVPASAAKGLEFDQVVLVEPAEIAGDGVLGLRLLYIALTRAVVRLSVVHTAPLPAALRVA
jgi:DNA helicase IV